MDESVIAILSSTVVWLAFSLIEGYMNKDTRYYKLTHIMLDKILPYNMHQTNTAYARKSLLHQLDDQFNIDEDNEELSELLQVFAHHVEYDVRHHIMEEIEEAKKGIV